MERLGEGEREVVSMIWIVVRMSLRDSVVDRRIRFAPGWDGRTLWSTLIMFS